MTTAEQFNAILHGAAYAPITDRAFLRITGTDATRWLNGMVTNSIQSLAPSEGNYNFLLNAQGRIQGDCTIYREPLSAEPAFLLATDKSQLDTIQQTLEKFIIMDDVELVRGVHILGSQRDPSPLGIAVTGLHADDIFARITFGARNENYMTPQPGTMTYLGHRVIVLPRLDAGVTTFEIWCDSRRAYSGLYRSLETQNVPHLSPETLEAFRIYSATPRYGTDIRNTDKAKDLPQETALNGGTSHALHFSKGCYLGQEIVERIRSRGQVHRTFTQFTLTGEMPTLPAVLEASLNGQVKPAGELTSAALIPLPEGDKLLALGYLRREFLTAALTYPGGTAVPVQGSPLP